MSRRFFVILLVGLAAASNLGAQEEVAKSRIVAASLFKNGLAVIKREVVVPGPGTFRLEDLPEPVHGTWWVESTARVETALRMREVDVPAAVRPDANLQDDLADKKVVLHLYGDKTAPVSGTVMKLPKIKDDPSRAGRFLVLKTQKGRLYVQATSIVAIEVEGTDDTVKQRKPVLVFTVDQADKKAQTIYVSYLTSGLAWAPSYKVDISEPKVLTVELAAVVKNELVDLEDAELQLISGFPSVQFANVTSLLAAKMRWAEFFQQIRGAGRRHHPLEGNGPLLTQQVLANTVRPGIDRAIDLSANPMGEGVDLHFQAIGKRTLGKDEALSLSIAKDKAAYERIVEWLIPDNRDELGRYGHRRDEDQEDAWDALRFKNPFAFPMTTGPAMVTAKGQFNGQRTSYYVNAGEETLLRITKALSIRTRHVEHEDLQKNVDREIVYFGGNRYRKSQLAGELAVSNHRREDVKVLIRRRFSGELVTADGNPKILLREEGVYSVNKRNELNWVVTLKGGEEKRLHYRYSVLVYH